MVYFCFDLLLFVVGWVVDAVFGLGIVYFYSYWFCVGIVVCVVVLGFSRVVAEVGF